VLFDGALTIDGGDLTLHCLHTPGHTPDHISIYLPAIDTLLAGDAAELPFPAAESPANLPVMRASIARLAGLQPAHVLYCHAPNDLGAQLLHDNLAYFDQVEEACRAALAAGLIAEELTDEALIAAVGCRFEEVTPSGGAWAEVDDEYRIARHADQLRDMISWLQG
jgi:glyoxylase-like metal-dependent hydrolase (beta-lactamase superfamily II)